MKRFLCLWLGVCLSGPASLWAADAKRPNILFAFADDWGRYAGAYAQLDGPGTINDVVRTPNFDRVAREGVLFRRAFVPAPSCTPCRSALLSGQHFWRTGRGAILLGAVWDGSRAAYPLMLRDAGYHIGEMYKVWGPGTPADAPYGAGKYAYEKAGRRFNQFSRARHEDGRRWDAPRGGQASPVRRGRQELRGLPGRAPEGPAVLLLVRTDQRASQVDQGIGQGPLGHRPGFAEGKTAVVPARCPGGPPGPGRLPR